MNKTLKIRTVTTYFIFFIMSVTLISLSRITDRLMVHDLSIHQKIVALNVSFIVTHALIIFFVTKVTQHFITSPIEKITQATTEVAQGNFSVEISETMRAEEIRQMAENFNIMTRELAAVSLLRTDFITHVSHEFKTPLSVIEGYASLLQNDQLDESSRLHYTTKIIEQTKRLKTLTGNILQLSYLENHEVILEKKYFSISEQLREIILENESAWYSKSLQLEIDIEEAMYYGNVELMAQVWQNLISNAIKFSHVSGKLVVTLKDSPQYLKIKVIDSGIGMDEKEQSLIFNKFYQCDTSHSTQGNGLGLTLVKKIVALHHGKIIVRSEKGKGSTFIITLPKRSIDGSQSKEE